jgi:two-component system phosphate regulon response regulator PhoB
MSQGLVLVVEDERDLLETLIFNLEREGYETRRAQTGEEALERAFEEPHPDLVVLDLMLPDISGTEVCKELRADERTAQIPVLMATARGEEIDRVVGFEVGADDYVVKPFSVRELLLRVRAILRRAGSGDDESAEDRDVIEFGPLTLDTAAHRLTLEEEEIQLTALEFKLLETFMRRRGRVQTRDVLLEDVWDMNANVVTRTVDTHVKRLREKLGPAGEFIETIRGVGYRFREHPDDES